MMTPIDAALNRSRTVLSLLLFILVAGFIAYVQIPKEADPDVNIPIIYVSMHHEGISPEDAERLLVRPMEKEMQSIEGLKELRSTAYEGGANVLAEFEAGFNADAALQDVREKVDLAKPELPEDTDEPSVNEVNLSLFPVLVVTLSGPAPERTLLRLARRLQDEIETIPTVLEAAITGDREESVELLIDPALVESYGLEPSELFTTIDRSNQLIAAGALDTGAGRFSIKVPGLFEGVDDILNQPLVSTGDAVVRVRDLAEVRRTFKDPTQFARVDGERAIALEISKRTGSNIIETIEAVRYLVDEAATRFPATVDVSYSQDKSEDIRIMLTDLQNNVISAVLLVMIVIVGALGVRGGLLVGVAIPGSFLAGILVLSMIGLTVNIVVLFALILSVGMLVDGAIVVTEYADRKLAEGESKEVAYGLAAKRMAWPIIASTATTLAAFMPLLFWPGVVGEFMKFMPITLIATLTASLAMALIFIPVLGARLGGIVRLVITLALAAAFGGLAFTIGGPALHAAGLGGAAPAAAAVGGLGGLILGWWLGGVAGRLIERQTVDRAKSLAAEAEEDQTPLDQIGGMTGLYVRTLGLALKAPSVVLGLALVTLIGAWGAYAQFGKGVEFFPDVEPEQLIVNIHARGNMAVREKDLLVRDVERELLAMQRAEGEFKTIYTSSGIFESRDDEAEDIVGKIQIEFVDWDERRPAAAIKAEIRQRTADLAGVWVEVREPEAGPPTGKPVHVQLSARDPSLLDDAVVAVREKMEGMSGLIDLEDSRPVPGIEWKLDVDRAQAAKFDADVTLIGSFIQMVTKGLKVSEYRPDDTDDEVDIMARFPERYRTVDQLDRVRINTGSGRMPIGNFVERSAEQKTGVLNRVDSRRIMYVRAGVEEGVLPDDKVREIRAWLEGDPLPAGVEVEFKGEDEEQQAAQDFLVKAFGVALFLMAVILVTQFNSFYSAFLILSAVVMSTVGVMLGLLAMGEPFGIVMSGIGVIALAGIVVNNNIVLIDTFDRLKKTSATMREAILRTGAQRLRPVLLTTVTTILGLMPMVLQTNIDFLTRTVSIGAPSTQWWVQLSTAIVFGLAFATVLTLIVTPSALMLRANLQARRARKASGDAPAQPQAAE
ncbi:MAG: efflux RND transporter permease subunit [Marivibrio sp.]|uniref:efflux RND transporter permease subunit n=1 Tax=Marivibrio sp. TaxID=2039719 RepID=UPI0032EBB5F0